ncbi:oligosaccharide flippase family protein [Flavobacterium franklandianum]|uniref:oligosaccharide flippase family protein n=1 Tax=Flavobacterium franklandianum TaxID=2594430 RepID=UPI00117ABD26|nr:oligosaccharide flippase family protein [Flavobacterium franklandianum]TRX29448.1 oligosaccharide flippase family protein [Flavobacterium franklandianum]
MKKSAKEAILNFSYVFISQGFSLILSISMSFIIPKILGIEEFGYWQFFLFLSSYVGFFHLGLLDGIYLRYGGKSFSEVDNTLLNSQFKILFVIELIVGLFVVLFALFYSIDPQKKSILIFASIYLILSNLSTFFGTVFQAFNRMKLFSISAVIDKVVFLVFLFFLFSFQVKNSEYYIFFYVIARLFGLIYSIYHGRVIVFAKALEFKKSLIEFKENLSVGSLLMLSNIAGMLILGVGRYLIEKTWGIVLFGKISFSISLTAFFLLFISQVSIVLFPLLIQRGSEQQKRVYVVGLDFLNIVLNGVYLFFPIVALFIKIWLPSYIDSIYYFVILLPLCLFDGKMQILFSTYMKLLRKEKLLLLFNVISLVIVSVFSIVGVLLNNLNFVIFSMTIAVAIRSIIVEVYLSKLYSLSMVKKIAYNLFLSILFCYVMIVLDPIMGFFIFLFFYVLYLILMKKEIVHIVVFIKELKTK